MRAAVVSASTILVTLLSPAVRDAAARAHVPPVRQAVVVAWLEPKTELAVDVVSGRLSVTSDALAECHASTGALIGAGPDVELASTVTPGDVAYMDSFLARQHGVLDLRARGRPFGTRPGCLAPSADWSRKH